MQYWHLPAELIVISYTTAGREEPSNLYGLYYLLINLGISSASKSFPLNPEGGKVIEKRKCFTQSLLDRGGMILACCLILNATSFFPNETVISLK